MLITRKSPLTGKINEMDLTVTLEQLARYAKGQELAPGRVPRAER